MVSEIRNVVLIVVDALRADRVGAYSGSDLTPNIDSLANDGEVFEQCFSCVNATDSSITTILTGLYPTHHGIINHGQGVTKKEQRFVSGTTSLPELLNPSHSTIGIDTLERWHQRGFDTYLNPRRSQDSIFMKNVKNMVDKLPYFVENAIRSAYDSFNPNDAQPISSDTITSDAIDVIRGENSPFFLFAHYWDTHIPYIPLEDHPDHIENTSYREENKSIETILEPIKGSPWASRLEEGLTGDATTVSELKRKYDAGVWTADQAIGQVVDELKEKDIYDETAIIVTADHGESFTEHGIIFDHHGLYDSTIHVPLIIKAPGFDGREDEFVQHFDLVPTILDLLNKDYQDREFDGVSLVEKNARTLDRNAVFAEEGHTARKRTIRTQSYKYIKRLDDQNECRYCGISHALDEELYNLENDPEENNNIIGENVTLKNRLNEQLNLWIEELPEPSEEESTYGTSQEVKDHLEDMGYL